MATFTFIYVIDLAALPEIGKPQPMTVKPLGDSAWWVEFPGEASLAQVLGLKRLLEKSQPSGVVVIVSSFASLAVHFHGGDALAIKAWFEAALRQPLAMEIPAGREFEIPVCYDGEDLTEVSKVLGLSPAAIIAQHSSVAYTVAAVGFSPGFPYLSGLPPALHLPRRQTPRLAVAAGAVAIAGTQAGIYPFTSPGGWHVLGRTDQKLFDPENSPPALLRAGDRVKFRPVQTLTGKFDIPMLVMDPCDSYFEIIQAGAMTTVQDLGRPGYEDSGVSPGGATDRESLAVANLLVGNPAGAAALEICLSGPILKFHHRAVIAWVDGRGKSREVAAGEVLDFSKLSQSVRAYFSIAGGIDVPKVLGSSATDLRAGFGGYRGRALQVGDCLQIGTPGDVPKPNGWHIGRAIRESQIELRYLAGSQHDWFSAEAHEHLRHSIYQLTPQSDRMGARLCGAALLLKSPREMISQPVAWGTIQVPPDGQPIILLAGRQTLGGYPQIGHVISVDLPKLARAWPTTSIRFSEVSWREAQQLRKDADGQLDLLTTGIRLKKLHP